VLVGREREAQELERVLATARSGRSAVLALVGEPGIGKTVLLDQAAARAGGLRVLQARGIETESHVPFAGLFELLRPALPLLERIPVPQAHALEGALALRPGGAGDRFAVGAATLSLLAAYAEQSPTLVLLDDAHVLDVSSGEALLFALRRLLAEPIAAVIAAREGEQSFLDGAGLPTLHVRGLDRGSASALLGALPADAADRLYDATAGNPLALLELGAAPPPLGAPVDAPGPVPAEISRAFLRRASGLDDDVRRLLVLAAAGDSRDSATLARAASSLGLDLLGLQDAESAGLVTVAGGLVEFRHPLVRAALYAEAPPERRREAHRALATALPDRDLDRRAWHLAIAAVGPDDGAASALEQAAARARERSAYAVASSAYERSARLASAEERRERLLFDAADAAWLGGEAARALVLLGDVGTTTTEVERLRAHIATHRGPVEEGYAILRDAAERVAIEDPELAVALLAEAVEAAFFAGATAKMLDAARRARELMPQTASDRTLLLTSVADGMARVFAGEGDGGIEPFRRAVAIAERSEELRADPQLLPWLVMGPLWIREAGAGRALVDAAVEFARSQTALGVLPCLLERVARDHAAGEQWDTALSEYDEAIRLARETGQDAELAVALVGVAWLEARKGLEASCRARAAEGGALCTKLGLGFFGMWAMRAVGELELALGRPPEAATHFEEEATCLRILGIGDVDTSPAAELVEVYLRLGRDEEAAATADAFEEQARVKGQPWSLARAARCRGLLAGDADFEPHFGEALALHERTPDVFEAARTRLLYGARLRRARRRVRSREELRAALAAFERLGATPWAEQARSELEATGETARRRDVSMRDTLTPQELQIAHMLAAGRTTRETAAALFLSPKTIEYHLRHVYRKLGVNSRGELAVALTPE
jgi:DNA-binding CsgD family transcriptional regulator